MAKIFEAVGSALGIGPKETTDAKPVSNGDAAKPACCGSGKASCCKK